MKVFMEEPRCLLSVFEWIEVLSREGGKKADLSALVEYST